MQLFEKKFDSNFNFQPFFRLFDFNAFMKKPSRCYCSRFMTLVVRIVIPTKSSLEHIITFPCDPTQVSLFLWVNHEIFIVNELNSRNCCSFVLYFRLLLFLSLLFCSLGVSFLDFRNKFHFPDIIIPLKSTRQNCSSHFLWCINK